MHPHEKTTSFSRNTRCTEPPRFTFSGLAMVSVPFFTKDGYSMALADILRIPWTPFFLCEKDVQDIESEVYRNSRYQLHVRRFKATKEGRPDLVHISLKRIDQDIFVPYDDLMHI